MKRIILHWTGGTYTPNAKDRRHYHRLIDGNGAVVEGDWPIEANAANLREDDDGRALYAAHTREANTGAIGVAFCAMHEGKGPGNPGLYPILRQQWEAGVRLCADLFEGPHLTGVEVTRRTLLSHAEVPLTLGVPQPGKWDITYVPWITSTDPLVIGDVFRSQVRAELARRRKPRLRLLLDRLMRAVGMFR